MGIKDGAGGANDQDPADLINSENDDDGGADGGEKTVSRQTYLKTVSEAKSARERARVAEEKASRLEQEKLSAAGDKDGEIKNLQKQLDDERKGRKSLQQTVVKKALNAQITTAATKAGCIDPSAVMRLIDVVELGEVDADTLEADADAVEYVIAELKKSKPYLFSKAGPKVNGKSPSGKIVEAKIDKEDLSKLTPTELRARLRKLDLA